MKEIALTICIVLMLYSCRNKDSSINTPEGARFPAGQSDKSTHTLEKTRSRVVFDVPSLLRISILDVRKKLGPPADELQANVTDTERSLIYNKNGLRLTIDYIVETNQVDIISLAATRDTTAYSYLVPLGNLNQDDTTYVIKPQQSEKSGYYHGILIQPTPPAEFPVAP